MAPTLEHQHHRLQPTTTLLRKTMIELAILTTTGLGTLALIALNKPWNYQPQHLACGHENRGWEGEYLTTLDGHHIPVTTCRWCPTITAYPHRRKPAAVCTHCNWPAQTTSCWTHHPCTTCMKPHTYDQNRCHRKHTP